MEISISSKFIYDYKANLFLIKKIHKFGEIKILIMKKIVKLCLLTIFMSLVSLEVDAQCVTKSGYYAATTEKGLELMVKYSVDKDYDALQKLLDAGLVFSMKSGMTVYIQDSSWTGRVEIRPKGMTGTVWTVKEAISC